jgi:hypothetical protein
MEAEQRLFQARAKFTKGEIQKKVALILQEFEDRQAEQEDKGAEAENGRQALELLRTLQDHGEQRCEHIMNVSPAPPGAMAAPASRNAN